MQKIITCLSCLVGLAGNWGCSKSDALRIAGSSTVLPIVSRAAEEFRLEHPDVNIFVNSGGSGVGINQVGEGKIAIGMASRGITPSEKASYPETNFFVHGIGKDAVVPVVSSEIYDAGVRSLTLEQIAGIYLGEISNWRAVGGPEREILVIDKEKSRGTRHVFMQTVLGDEKAEAPGADLVLGSNNEEQTAIVQSDAAIGMLSHAWLNDEVKGLAIMMSDNRVVEPSLENITGGAFPITRDLFLITNGTARGTAKDFIDFILSPNGQKIIESSGYVRVVQ